MRVDDIGPWTVKGVTPEDRAEINRAAKRADMNVGAWLTSAAQLAIHRERQGPLGPPGEPLQGPPSEDARVVALEVVTRLGGLLPGLTEASHGRRVVALSRRVMEHHLRVLLDGAQGPAQGKRPATLESPVDP